ncbi:mucin-19-like [Muntiacus reevesi]|uniref:mucin-19-like n=1 Tax=Muntiacus reevesi TaxID=9886 RepID=UPI0033077B8B
MRKKTRDVKVIQWLIQKFRNQQGFGIDMRTEMKAVWINAPHCGQTSRRHLLPPGAENPLGAGTTLGLHGQQVEDAGNSYTPGHQEIPIHKTTDTLVFNLPSQGSSSTTPGRRKTRVPAGAARAVDAAGGEEKCEANGTRCTGAALSQMRGRAGGARSLRPQRWRSKSCRSLRGLAASAGARSAPGRRLEAGRASLPPTKVPERSRRCPARRHSLGSRGQVQATPGLPARPGDSRGRGASGSGAPPAGQTRRYPPAQRAVQPGPLGAPQEGTGATCRAPPPSRVPTLLRNWEGQSKRQSSALNPRMEVTVSRFPDTNLHTTLGPTFMNFQLAVLSRCEAQSTF